MDLRDYVRVLRKGWATILAFVILGVGAGVGLTLATTKVYQASAQLLAYVNNGGQSSTISQDNTYAQQIVQSLTSAVTTPTVMQEAVRTVYPNLSQAQRVAKANALRGDVTADAPLNKVLLNLHATSTDPVFAAKFTNALADAFTKKVPSLVTPKNGQSALTLNVIQPASVPSSPVKPNKLLNIGLGLVVGLLIGVGVAVLREILDNTVKGPSDFEDMGVAVLGLVPFDKRTPRSPIAFRSDPHSGRSEAYRQLRTNLQFVDVDNPPRIIAVTSAIPGEGKSTTALNLAASLAEAGARVCLVEADLRRPSIAKALGLVGDVGFTTVVIGKAPVESVLQNAGRNLAILTSGPIPPNPSELLISQHARQVITDLAANVDFVIIDTPPLLPVTDGAELATICDATLLVHRAGKTTRDQALRSVQALEKVGRKPVGVILNMIARGSGKYDYEYGYYYTAYRPDRGDGKGAHTANGSADTDTGIDIARPLQEQGANPFAGPAGSPTDSSRN